MEMIKISKKMSYYLRHHPEELNLRLDKEGFTNIELEEFASRMDTKIDLIKKIVNEDEKNRFEIKNNRIRANYGHSIPVGKIIYEDTETISREQLPKVLYHGTKQNVANKIMKEGIKSLNRQFVHLSINRETAKKVGNRRTGRTRIVEIDTQKALEKGVQFWKAGPTTVIASNIPPDCINLTEEKF